MCFAVRLKPRTNTYTRVLFIRQNDFLSRGGKQYVDETYDDLSAAASGGGGGSYCTEGT